MSAKKEKPKPLKMILFRSMVGYYTVDGGPTKPAYDPSIPGNCPICGEPWTVQNVRTVTVRWQNSDESLPGVLLFYRVHAFCDEKISRSEKQALDAQALLIGDRVARDLKKKAQETL